VLATTILDTVISVAGSTVTLAPCSKKFCPLTVIDLVVPPEIATGETETTHHLPQGNWVGQQREEKQGWQHSWALREEKIVRWVIRVLKRWRE
jgi:hypothetical protein